jgi:prophage DNA circulation protein
LKSERGKRQRAQEELAEAKQRLAAYEEAAAPTPTDQFWSAPDEHLARVESRIMNATLRASQAELVANHGKAALDAVQEAIARAMEANHPDMPVLREAMIASNDPAGVAMDWYQQVGGQLPRRQSGPVFPSNLASARNVGARRGPAWSGPMPLEDIFKR